MNRIANMLKAQIEDLEYIEIAAGLAKPYIVRNNATLPDAEDAEMIDKIIPMAYNDLGIVCESGDLYTLTPDTSKMSIVWWEDNGIETVNETTYYYHCVANIMCVGWWNLPKINSSYTDASLLVANLIAEIPQRLTNADYFSQIQVSFAGEVPNGAEILSKYTLDEAENQFATFPFAVTGLNFTVDFAFGKNCPDSVTLNPSIC